MRTNRDAAMTYVFVDEGGYAERPMEPGGAHADEPELLHHQFGPKTLWAAMHRDGKVLINALCDTRLARNKTLRSYTAPVKPGSKTTFGMVWDRRTELVRGRALKMVA